MAPNFCPDKSNQSCSLTTKEMLVILLDVKDDRPRQLHLREQVEISQDEEHLALSLKLRDHKLLESK